MRRWLIGSLLALMLVICIDAHADDRRHGHESRNFPFGSEHWEGWRRWTPDRHMRRRGLPDDFTIDKPGKCEVRCVRSGRDYRCREYRC
jgi:hypothetical protein